MKIRQGFVSNSSSSSFVVAWKGDLKKELKKAFDIPLGDNYPIKSGFCDFSGVLFSRTDNTKGMTKEEIIEEWGYDEEDWEDPDTYVGMVAKWLEDGYKVSFGSLTDEEGDGIEAFLCMNDIDYESPNFIIKHDGGY